jgi:hypothetical protein
MSLGKTGNTYNNLISSKTAGVGAQKLNSLESDTDDDIFSKSVYADRRPESARIRLSLRDSLLNH